MPAPLKPIIYIAFANDLENPARNLAGLAIERKNIEAALNGNPETEGRDGRDRLVELLRSWDLVETADCTPRKITEPFYSNRVAIFHYGGHANPESLLLQTEDGANVPIGARALIPFLRDQKSLRLIFLNACSTRKWAEELTSDADCPFCIIATACPVQDPVAMKFARDFYASLASDSTLQEAFDAAVHGAGVNLTGSTRDFANLGPNAHVTGELPWALYPKDSPVAKTWRLTAALKNPLLGVPPLGSDYPIPKSSPYVSISGHQKEDAQIFFGRNAEIRSIYDWAAKDSPTPIMLLYGQSGSGKSSLLRAGVWPRLEARARIAYYRRDENLTDDLNLALSMATATPDPDEAAAAWLHSDRPAVILLDQVEEAITHSAATSGKNGNAELTAFFERIASLFLDPQTRQPRLPGTKARLILSFRKEFLAEIRNPIVERLPGLVQDFWLERLTERNIVGIVQGPVLRDELHAQYKIGLEPGFAEHLASVLYDPHSPVATVLQLELNRLWALWHPADADADAQAALLDPSGLLQRELLACRSQQDPLGRDQSTAEVCYSRALYTQVSSSNALQQFVEEQLHAIDDPALNQGLELDLLYEHTSSLATGRRRSLTELRALYKDRLSDLGLDRLLTRNKELHLLADPAEEPAALALSSSADDDSATVLAHDTLAPVIRREFDRSTVPGPRARRILEDHARTWQENQTGDTLDAADLRTVARGLPHMRATTSAEDRLLAVSRKRLRKRLASAVAVFLIVVGIAGGIAWHERNVAQFQADNKLSVSLAGEAKAAIADQFQLSLLLSAAAWQFQHTPQARDAIVSVNEFRPDAVAVLSLSQKAFGTLVFSPDSRQLLVSDGDALELWDVASRHRLWSITDTKNEYHTFAFSHDGHMLALAAFGEVQRGAVQVRQTATHTVVSQALPGAPDNVTSLAFSPDGKYLAAAGDCDQVQVWALPGFHRLRDVAKAQAACSKSGSDIVVFNPTRSDQLAGWSSTGKLWLEDTKSGAAIAVIRQPGGDFSGASGLAFSKNGARLAAVNMSGGIDLFDLTAHNKKLGVIQAASNGGFRSVSLNAGGSLVAAATGDGSIGVWNSVTQIPVKGLSDGGGSIPWTTAFSPNFTLAAVKAQDGDVLLLDTTRAHVNVSGTSFATEPPGIFVNPAIDPSGAVAASPDGKWVATGTYDGYVILWDAAKRLPVWVFSGADFDRRPGLPTFALAFTPDSKILLFPVEGRVWAHEIAIHRLDLTTTPFHLLPDLAGTPGPSEIGITGIAAAPDGSVAAVSDTGTIRLWDPSGRATVSQNLTAPIMNAPLAVSPDGSLLAAYAPGGKGIVLIDAKTRQPKSPILAVDRLYPEAIAFSPAPPGRQSRFLAAGGAFGFYVWDLTTRKQTTGPQGNVNRLAFSPDASLLAVGLENGQTELWDVAAGQIIGQPLTPSMNAFMIPSGVAFSADGAQLLAGTYDGYFRMWDWRSLRIGDLSHDFDNWPDRACRIAGRNLTRDEWTRYIGPGVRYRRICPSMPENLPVASSALKEPASR